MNNNENEPKNNDEFDTENMEKTSLNEILEKENDESHNETDNINNQIGNKDSKNNENNSDFYDYQDIKKYILKNKLIVSILFLSILLNIMQLFFVANYNNKNKEYIETLDTKISSLNTSVEEKNIEINALKKVVSENDTLINSQHEKIELAKPWLELNEDQRKIINVEIEELKAKEQAELEAIKKAQEEEAAKKAEEERKAKEKAEKEKYNTGITYNQLARNPDDYLLKYCKFKGKVLQVMEGDGYNHARIAVNSNYDNVLYIEYNPNELDYRLLEDDIVTVYGVSMGIYSYKSVLGSTISIPSMVVEKIS